MKNSCKIQARTVGASCLTSSVRIDVAEGENSSYDCLQKLNHVILEMHQKCTM
jgi:hypothetical protein